MPTIFFRSCGTNLISKKAVAFESHLHSTLTRAENVQAKIIYMTTYNSRTSSLNSPSECYLFRQRRFYSGRCVVCPAQERTFEGGLLCTDSEFVCAFYRGVNHDFPSLPKCSCSMFQSTQNFSVAAWFTRPSLLYVMAQLGPLLFRHAFSLPASKASLFNLVSSLTPHDHCFPSIVASKFPVK